MFDWRKRVEILRAENALRDGRLDEAFTIASDRELRDWRGCQVVLEKLVDPLLARAEAHLAEGRLEDALADVGRAQAAGGNRPRVAELRAKVCGRMEERQRERIVERDRVASARRHLAQGSVGAGKAALEEIEAADPEAVRLAREVRNREERARDACASAEMLLGQGAILEAARAISEAAAACARHDALPGLVLKLKTAAVAAIDRALRDGSLAAARDLHSEVVAAGADSLETRRAAEVLALSAGAARAIESGDLAAARTAIARLRGLLPGAAWIEDAERAAIQVQDGLQALRSGPLGGPPPDGPVPAAGGPAFVTTVCGWPAGPRPAAAEAPAPDGAASRFILWVDGVGSYLVLRSERVTIGRSGSSAHPDLPLAADLAGIQAEVLRVDDDYFVVAHGPVEVNGRKVERKLLEDGDRIRFSPRCEVAFRLPTALSTSAIIELAGSQRIAGDVRKVILLDANIIIGKEEGCHVQADEAGSRIVLVADGHGLTARSDDGIMVDGRPAGKEARVAAGSRIQVGQVTFTVTPPEGKRS